MEIETYVQTLAVSKPSEFLPQSVTNPVEELDSGVHAVTQALQWADDSFPKIGRVA